MIVKVEVEIILLILKYKYMGKQITFNVHSLARIENEQMKGIDFNIAPRHTYSHILETTCQL